MTSLLEQPPLRREAAGPPCTWRDFFHNWPSGLSQRGVVTTLQNEQIPFCAFVTSQEMLLLERPNPDTVGARRVLLPFANIAALKITDVVEARLFRSAGFRQTAASDRREDQ